MTLETPILQMMLYQECQIQTHWQMGILIHKEEQKFIFLPFKTRVAYYGHVFATGNTNIRLDIEWLNFKE